MAFITREEFTFKNEKEKIDLAGPQGNAFYLLGRAKSLSNQLGIDWKEVENKMTLTDYQNLITQFNEYFGEYVDLIEV